MLITKNVCSKINGVKCFFIFSALLILITVTVGCNGGGNSDDDGSTNNTNNQITAAGTWEWTEKQIEIIRGDCADIGDVETYSISITQSNGNIILNFSDLVYTGSITGTINGNSISASGTIQLNDSRSFEDTINLTVSADGKSLTGTLYQESDDPTICTGTFEINASKSS